MKPQIMKNSIFTTGGQMIEVNNEMGILTDILTINNPNELVRLRCRINVNKNGVQIPMEQDLVIKRGHIIGAANTEDGELIDLQPQQPAQAEPVEEEVKRGGFTRAELQAKYKEIYGQKPHHMMSNDNLRKALNVNPKDADNLPTDLGEVSDGE